MSRHKQSEERINLMLGYRAAGLSYREIGKRLGVSDRTVYQYCREREPQERVEPIRIEEYGCKLCVPGTVMFVGNAKTATCDSCGFTFDRGAYWRRMIAPSGSEGVHDRRKVYMSDADTENLKRRKNEERKRRKRRSA
ncbi:MAG TPA: helix-turn-helix domain-containing protein [Phycisphaerae bacterium]|nr:helix-turn-helix domain-containing protein [Phycisphaerae bacterium]